MTTHTKGELDPTIILLRIQVHLVVPCVVGGLRRGRGRLDICDSLRHITNEVEELGDAFIGDPWLATRFWIDLTRNMSFPTLLILLWGFRSIFQGFSAGLGPVVNTSGIFSLFFTVFSGSIWNSILTTRSYMIDHGTLDCTQIEFYTQPMVLFFVIMPYIRLHLALLQG